jgi:hypothetical protein
LGNFNRNGSNCQVIIHHMMSSIRASGGSLSNIPNFGNYGGITVELR